MEDRVNNITDAFSKVEYVKVTRPFVLDGEIVKGAIEINAEPTFLTFELEIYPPYPFQYHDVETIRFINKDLIIYDHVNGDGSICVHTLHSPHLATKVELDLNSLRQWIVKYFINKIKDSHYEHIVVSPSGTGKNQALWFTEVNYKFKRGEFGQFHFSILNTGLIKEQAVQTFILQEFKIKGQKLECLWNDSYKKLDRFAGIFLFIGDAPVENRRFAVQSWHDLEPFVDQSFLKYLYEFEVNLKKNTSKGVELKLIIGYNIDNDEIHWQCINFSADSFPNYVEKTGPKTYQGGFLDQSIDWMHSKNCSPKYFFGRGALSKRLTESKILVVGIGAIGSMLCNTLVRGGCLKLFINDHDVKEPDNVCRSEYQFSNGMVSKVYELRNQLSLISPFVEIMGNEELTDIIKRFRSDANWQATLEEALNQVDYIFDCTTDNDLAYIFSQLNIKSEVINISITNHAKELVCVFKHDQYKWLMEIFKELKNDTVDLYNPTGCWSPTFKASYNDIAVLVQFAVKQINLNLDKDQPLRNFYLSTSDDSGFEIKLNQF
ncbi:ThiF family adenylyltransferase [Mucilaginibacter sp. 44-25]|uniref:ThiF family adenylyltransferase n=1 Tax=Mucilaginibacter sp. 44-25 TaxID=1895794 RepID=UPI0009632F30|nr:ThiF family adenylyltransferase [Mucilaginibacter sp. 44-25]OJW17277.1 MAG: hypothetical protein BGO48_06895 [Mucilaginibacter sp. 44-25]